MENVKVAKNTSPSLHFSPHFPVQELPSFLIYNCYTTMFFYFLSSMHLYTIIIKWKCLHGYFLQQKIRFFRLIYEKKRKQKTEKGKRY